jgi:hypothetical protein
LALFSSKDHIPIARQPVRKSATCRLRVLRAVLHFARMTHMGIRPGNNPKRRVAPPDCLSATQKDALARAVRYVGSGHHKRNPADYGLERTNPRPTKSLCDLNRPVLLTEALALLNGGIALGMFSAPGGDGFPKFIWGVSANGEVFEAKTDAGDGSGGTYHGYPLEDEDAMRDYITAIWRQRCQATGQ